MNTYYLEPLRTIAENSFIVKENDDKTFTVYKRITSTYNIPIKSGLSEEEVNTYTEKLKRLPNIGAIVKTADGEGEVSMVETLKERIKVKFKDGEDIFFK